MADIAFLLIVFFMVTTIFKLEQGLAITLPRSTAGEKIPREKVAHIWIDRNGTISIDDLVIGVQDIEPMILAKLRENPALIVWMTASRDPVPPADVKTTRVGSG